VESVKKYRRINELLLRLMWRRITLYVLILTSFCGWLYCQIPPILLGGIGHLSLFLPSSSFLDVCQKRWIICFLELSHQMMITQETIIHYYKRVLVHVDGKWEAMFVHDFVFCSQVFFFFDNRHIWCFAPTRSLEHCAKRPLHIGRVKLGLSSMGVVLRNCFHSRGVEPFFFVW
jgi:hypothetical protein